MVPLIVVAALIAFNQGRAPRLDDEASQLATTLDRTLDRRAPDAARGLAILPLVNDSADPALDYLAVGVADDIRDQLADVSGLRLIGARSSANVATQPLSHDSMARLLGVDHVLYGALRGDAAELVIELTLFARGDASGGWTESWRSPATALPNTTSAVAARLMASVLPGDAATPPTGGSAPSGDALDHYLRGKYLIDRYNADDVLSGIGYMENAIAADTDFERAYWGKITGHARMTWVDAQSADVHNRLKKQTADEWLALGIEAPLTYRLQAMEASRVNRYVEADAAFRRAVALAPRQYAYDRGYMIDLCIAGYLERCLEQAVGVARTDPVSAAAHTALANVYRLLGDGERMLEHAALSGRFGGDMAGFYEAIALLDERQWEEGAAKLKQGLESVAVSSTWVDAWVAALADPSLADAAVTSMSEVDDASLDWLDLLYSELAAIGRVDDAYAMADRLIAEGFETWNLYVWTPGMATFRADPRFAGLMERAGIMALWRVKGPPDLCSGAAPEGFCGAIDAERSDGQ